jgi:hypothetical protein
VLACACYHASEIASPDEVLSIDVGDLAIPADGFSTTTLAARISRETDPAIRITFEATKGVVLNQTSSPDASGTAVAVLRSDTTPGRSIVTVTARNGDAIKATRTVEVTFETALPNAVISVAVGDTRLPADGVSSTEIRVGLDPRVEPRTVALTTTSGSFAQDESAKRSLDLTLGAEGQSKALLYAPTSVGAGLIVATGGGFSADASIEFVRALPGSISLGASPVSVDSSSPSAITLTAVLSRGTGVVSPGTIVEYSATRDGSGQAVGSFQAITRSNSEGVSTAQFVLASPTPPGSITVRARVPDANASAKVQIVVEP